MGKSRTKIFRAGLGKFGQKSFAPPNMCLLLYLDVPLKNNGQMSNLTRYEFYCAQFSKWSISTLRGQLNHLRGQIGVNEYLLGSTGASNSKLLLIRQGMQTAFFNKSNKIKRVQISATVILKCIRFEQFFLKSSIVMTL